MKMIDSQTHGEDGSDNGNNNQKKSNGKIPGSALNGGPHAKIVKFTHPSTDKEQLKVRPHKTQACSSSYSYEEIQRQKQALPIFPTKQKLVDEIRKHSTLIVIGETGSGKTTQIPQFIYESKTAGMGAVAVTQVLVSLFRSLPDADCFCKASQSCGHNHRWKGI